ncbi:unnamed protein product [Malus baccata var. baccata]
MTDSTAALISSNPEQGIEASFHEVKNQVLIALPFVVTNLCFHLPRLISIMFAGHLGELELAGDTLANVWATTTGWLKWSSRNLVRLGPILISIHQDQQIVKYAALYIKYFIPGLFPYAILQNILRFMQTESVVLPLYFFSLVHWTALRYKGAPLAASISIWISMLMLVVYVMRAKKFERTWGGFSSELFHCVLTNLKLALPTALMVW